MVENFNNAVINGYLFDEVLWNLFKASPCFVFTIKCYVSVETVVLISYV